MIPDAVAGHTSSNRAPELIIPSHHATLQHHPKPRKQSQHNQRHSQPIALRPHKEISPQAACPRTRSTTPTWLTPRKPSLTTSLRCRLRSTNHARLDSFRVLCTARMILNAVRSAGVVGAAFSYAIYAPLRADVVGEGLAILRDVGAQTIGADAGVG